MSRRSLIAAVLITAVVTAIVSVSMTTRLAGQSTRPARTSDGKPNISGVWQVNNEANWDLQPHEARAGAVTQRGIYGYAYAQVPAAPVLALGAAGIVPGSIGVVQGDGQIPYTADAAKRQQCTDDATSSLVSGHELFSPHRKVAKCDSGHRACARPRR